MKAWFTFIFILCAFRAVSQNQHALINNDWYISNYTLSDLNVLENDTLVLRRFESENLTADNTDSVFETSKLWNIIFEESGEFSIGWIDYLAAAKGGEPQYYHEMYPCENCFWKFRKKTLRFSAEGTSYCFITSREVNRKDEIILVKLCDR